MWTVVNTKSVAKALKRLPPMILQAFTLLQREIEMSGPVRGNWSNYGKLRDKVHHCHLKKGKPTYAAVWIEVKGQIKVVEIQYVGTHEGAPY